MDSSSQHACEATSRSASNVVMTRRPTELSHLREELRRGVRFTQQAHEDMTMPPQYQDASSPLSTDDEGSMTEAFLGLVISPDDHDAALPPRPASFSGSARPRMVTSSPPVPIPQTHWQQRRSSMSSTSRSRSSNAVLIPSHDHQYSKTQCEARLWDEYWNYKLSLESRESFEASTNNQRDGQALPTKNDPQAKRRTISEASTEDTIQDSSDELPSDTAVFDMDDL